MSHVPTPPPLHGRPGFLRAGEVIAGHYVIEGLLDEGGMAMVYLAVNTATGKRCAIKTLQAQLGDHEEFVRLFAKEARITSVIGDNEHIVTVFDAGIDPERSLPFIVMELLEGATLERVLADGPLSTALVRLLLDQLCHAITQAHEAGVVHRDLKPSNLFLTEDRHREPMLKVMDFGIAKVMQGGMARTATQIGTPAYNAPEQMGATTRKLAARQGITIAAGVTPATDVWALGLLAFELFTGEPPGQFWNVQTAAELPMKIAFEELEKPSDRAGDNADLLPAGFDEWFARCLEKDAGDRFATFEEATDAIFELLEDGRVEVSDAELETVATRLRQPGLSQPRLPQFTEPLHAKPDDENKSTRPSEPPPLPRISSPAITIPALNTDAPPSSRGARRLSRSRDGRQSSRQSSRQSARQSARQSSHQLGPQQTAPPVVSSSQPPSLIATQPGRMGQGRRKSSRGYLAVASVLFVATVGIVGYRMKDRAAQSSNTTSIAGDSGCSATRPDSTACLTRCKDGDAAACHIRGDHLLQQNGRDVQHEGRTALASACGTPLPSDTSENVVGKWVQEAQEEGCVGEGCLPAACVSLADSYDRQSPRRPRMATALYQRTCRIGTGDDMERGSNGCVGLGRRRERAGAIAAARTYYGAACEDGLTAGCVALAHVLERGGANGEWRDEKRARALYQKACDQKDLEGCTRLGRMAEHGRGGWKKNLKDAVVLYQRSCDGGELLGCVELAKAHERGHGGLTRDSVRAAELIQDSCDKGSQLACAGLAEMVRQGRGGLQRSEKRTFQLNQTACDAGEAVGCAQLAQMYFRGEAGLTKDVREGKELLNNACQSGLGDACVALARREAPTLSTEELRERYDQACRGGALDGCVALGEHYEKGDDEVSPDLDRAVSVYERACEDGAMRACTQLANLTYQGLGGLEKDIKASARLNQRACRGGDQLGCVRLGVLYALGQGVPKNAARARQLHQDTCGRSVADEPDLAPRCDTLKSLVETAEATASPTKEAKNPSEKKRAVDNAKSLVEQP